MFSRLSTWFRKRSFASSGNIRTAEISGGELPQGQLCHVQIPAQEKLIVLLFQLGACSGESDRIENGISTNAAPFL